MEAQEEKHEMTAQKRRGTNGTHKLKNRTKLLGKQGSKLAELEAAWRNTRTKLQKR